MKPCEFCGSVHESYQAHIFPVANAIPVANKERPVVANKSMDGMRVQLWREANRDRYNARQRELMRKRRAS